jgi:hypothetical protein
MQVNPHMKTRRSACRLRISDKTSAVLKIFVTSFSLSRIISKLLNDQATSVSFQIPSNWSPIPPPPTNTSDRAVAYPQTLRAHTATDVLSGASDSSTVIDRVAVSAPGLSYIRRLGNLRGKAFVVLNSLRYPGVKYEWRHKPSLPEQVIYGTSLDLPYGATGQAMYV